MNLTRRQFACVATAACAPGIPAKVQLQTALGPIDLALAIHQAPLSCQDFLKYVAAGAYAGGRIFRTVRPDNDHGHPKITVVQGGTRPGAPSFPPIAHEATAITGLRHRNGTLSLPRDAPGTASGAEFFICLGDQPALDAGGTRNPDRQGFAAFGQVTQGMDIVRQIWAGDATGASDDAYTAGQMLRVPIRIKKAVLF